MRVAVGTDVTILASAVIVLGAIAALARSLLKFRDSVRDNSRALTANTQKIDSLSVRLDRDYAKLAARVDRLERGRRLRCCAVVTVCQWLPKLSPRHKPSCCLSSIAGGDALGFGGDTRGLCPLKRQGQRRASPQVHSLLGSALYGPAAFMIVPKSLTL